MAGIALATSAYAQWTGTWRATSTYRSRLTTSSNWKLFEGTGGDSASKWYYKGTSSKPSPLAKPFLYSGTTRYHVDVDLLYGYQCTDFVKDVAGKNVPTGNWRPGTALVSGSSFRTDIPFGTVFATFTNGTSTGRYPLPTDNPHTFVFLKRISATVIEVADQNWDFKGHIWKQRRIRIGGSGATDASRYYAVKNI